MPLEHEDLVEYVVEMDGKPARSMSRPFFKTFSDVFPLKKCTKSIRIEYSFGIGIRVLVDGSISFTSLNYFSKKLIKEKVEEAVKIEKFSSKI